MRRFFARDDLAGKGELVVGVRDLDLCCFMGGRSLTPNSQAQNSIKRL